MLTSPWVRPTDVLLKVCASHHPYPSRIVIVSVITIFVIVIVNTIVLVDVVVSFYLLAWRVRYLTCKSCRSFPFSFHDL